MRDIERTVGGSVAGTALLGPMGGTLGGIAGATGMLDKKARGPKTPGAPQRKGMGGAIDYSKLAQTLKQTQALEGKAISPDIMKALMAGEISGQIAPAIEREERAMDREMQERWRREQLKLEKKTAEAAGKAGLGSVIGAGIGMATPLGPAGAAIGAGIGGALGGASIICTELYRQKLITKKVYLGAIRYREEYIDDEAYAGYLMWADGVVKAMQKSSKVTKLVSFFWIPLTKDMASHINNTKPNLFGRMLTKIIVPFSRCVYKIKSREVSYA